MGVNKCSLYDLKLSLRFCLGVALKTNTWGLVLAGSREAERITSQIRAGSANKETTKEGFSHIQHIFILSLSVWLLSREINISTFQLNYFPKNEGLARSSEVMQLQLPQNGEKHVIIHNVQFDRVFHSSVIMLTKQSVGGTQWHIKHIDHGGTF